MKTKFTLYPNYWLIQTQLTNDQKIKLMPRNLILMVAINTLYLYTFMGKCSLMVSVNV